MRKSNTMKNLITSMIPFALLAILGFVRVGVLMDKLGIEIFAINQLFFQLFAYISLVEAGVGTLIQQQYYKFLIDINGNKDKIIGLYNSSKILLKKISIIILIIGFFVSFFLKLLTNNHITLIYMQIVFMIFIFRSVLEYLTFSPRLVLQADQKVYKINFVLNLYRILEVVVEVSILYLGGNYLIILLVSTIIRFICYLLTNKKIFKEYPWLKTANKNQRVDIKGISSILLHRISGAVYSNTDILLISTFLSPLKVAIYAAYNYIFKFINDFIAVFYGSVLASFGNVMHKEKDEDSVSIFEEINAFFFFCAVILSISLFYVTNNFVILWIGASKLIDYTAFLLMVVLLFNNIAKRPLFIINDSKGLFKETRLIAILEAVINFILSVILIKIYGLVGVLMATLIAALLTSFWFYPIYMYKKVLKSSVIQYYFKYLMSLAFVIFICLISNIILGNMNTNSYLLWFIYSVIYFIVIFILAFVTNYFLSAGFRRFCHKMFLLIKDFRKKGANKDA